MAALGGDLRIILQLLSNQQIQNRVQEVTSYQRPGFPLPIGHDPYGIGPCTCDYHFHKLSLFPNRGTET